MPTPTATIMIPYSALDELLLRGSRSAQPAASAVTPGTLYSVTDEGNAIEQSTGTAWVAYAAAGGGGGGAPTSAHYVTTQAESGLSAESNLGALASGLLKQSVASGVATPAIAVAGAGGDYVAPGLITSSGLTALSQTLLGRASAGTGAVETITPGCNLSFSSTSATLFGVGAVTTIAGPGAVNDQPNGYETLRCTNTALTTLTGIVAGTDGQIVRVIAAGTGQVDLAHADTRSASGNRLTNFFSSGPTSLAPGGNATYRYEAAAAVWRLIAHTQGSWIAVPYNASLFTPDVGTWTVDAGDVANYKYRTEGRTLFLNYYLQTTTVAGSPAVLNVQLPSTFTPTMNVRVAGVAYDGVFRSTFVTLISGATVVQHQRQDLAAWATSTNGTYVSSNFAFELN